MESSAERKASLRTELWRRRRTLSDAAREAAGQRIADLGLAWTVEHAPAGGTVTVYLGVGAEPPTDALIERLYAAGFHVLLPICEPERQLSWVEWRPGIALARSAFAPIQEPVGPRLDTCAVHEGDDKRPAVAAVLLPATAVDGGGRRLGQGGGYYDRFLARLGEMGSRPATAAIVFDDEVLASGAIPDEPFDQHVEAVVTPSGLKRFGNTAA